MKAKQEPSEDIIEFGKLMDSARRKAESHRRGGGSLMGGFFASDIAGRAIPYFTDVIYKKEHYRQFALLLTDVLEREFEQYVELGRQTA